jgi:polyphosphate kinase
VLVPGTVERRLPHPRSTTCSILELHPPPHAQVRYLNRELSWLQFNERVLALAEDPELELLERAKFLAIFQTNLDEFVQVRVAGLKEQEAAEVTGSNPDRMSPGQQLAALRTLIAELATDHARIFRESLVPALATPVCGSATSRTSMRGTSGTCS